MECICPYCGRKSRSSDLCFDFSEQFKLWKKFYFAGCAREDVERFGSAFEGLVGPPFSPRRSCWPPPGSWPPPAPGMCPGGC